MTSMTNLQSTSEPLREKIVSYYKNIDPLKLGTIDILLEKYKGREDELLLDIKRNIQMQTRLLIKYKITKETDRVSFNLSAPKIQRRKIECRLA